MFGGETVSLGVVLSGRNSSAVWPAKRALPSASTAAEPAAKFGSLTNAGVHSSVAASNRKLLSIEQPRTPQLYNLESGVPSCNTTTGPSPVSVGPGIVTVGVHVFVVPSKI